MIALTFPWENVLLLGWYGADGRAHISEFKGNVPILHVVVTGCDERLIPLGDGAPVPDGAKVMLIPEGRNPSEYAREIGGVHAIGWEMHQSIERKESNGWTWANPH